LSRRGRENPRYNRDRKKRGKREGRAHLCFFLVYFEREKKKGGNPPSFSQPMRRSEP